MTLPSIPDNFYKILITIGIGLFVYASHEFKQTSDLYDKNTENLTKWYNEAMQEHATATNLLVRIKEESNLLSVRYGVMNPFSKSDSIVTFIRVLKGSALEQKMNDSLWSLYIQYKIISANKKNPDILLQEYQTAMQHQLGMINDASEEKYYLSSFGVFLVGFGLFGLFLQQIQNNRLLFLQVKEKGKLFDLCQSCGRYFSIIRPKGTDANSNESNGFCHECYQQGNFTQPTMTKDQMIRLAISKVPNHSYFKKRALKRRINSLVRWQDNEYFN